MSIRKFTLLVFFFINSAAVYSQDSILDLMVKEGDTLYGAIRSNGTNKLWLYEKKLTKDGKVNMERHSVKGATVFRKDGELYYLKNKEDRKKSFFSGGSIFNDYEVFIPALRDYVVTIEKDTIYGKINSYNGRIIRFRNQQDRKLKLKEDRIPALRYNSRIYRLKEKQLAGYGDEKDFHLMVLVEGEVNLYAHHYGDGFKTRRFYYIEKGEQIVKIPASDYGHIMEDMFADDPNLLERLRAKEFTPENMVLVVKLYNNREDF